MSRNSVAVVALLVLFLLQVGVKYGPDIVPPVLTNDKVDRVTYVYEKDDGGVPPQIAKAMMDMNAVGIVATEFEDDTVDGDGQVPDQHKVADTAAKDVGQPCLVSQAGEKVIRVIKTTKATTYEQAMEAAK